MDIFSMSMAVYAVLSLSSGALGARLGSRRECGALRPFLWGLLFPVVGLARPLLSRKVRKASAQNERSPLTRAQVDELIKDSLREVRENEVLKTQVRELQEKIRSLESGLDSSREESVQPAMKEAARQAVVKRFSEEEMKMRPSKADAPESGKGKTHVMTQEKSGIHR